MPLFPQGNPAQRGYPDWPPSFDAGMRVTWRQLQPTDPRTLAPGTPDDAKYDFSAIDNELDQLGNRGMRLMLRVWPTTPAATLSIRTTPTSRSPTGCAQSPALPPRFRRRPTAG